ncbi:hypothetical protein FA13DRAFT_1867552 [Coprinellus micaceus]|uniref:DUF659 domain-containing protein n=1 Tax=Coprinellus micaceus TaxID=71717 RepID=A0A4Y7TUB5_COPMI|nr:hypothetical protein FA13DRAFT_1867552 [Coprinellus micaceus]
MPQDQAQRQNDFNHDIVCLFSACELSWYLLDRPEFRHFTAKWIPNVKLPDCCTASGPLLKAEVKRITKSTKNRVSSKLANYQCDGWKNVAKVNVISLMIVVENEAIPVRTHDQTGRPKTGDELFRLVKDDFTYAKETFGIEVVLTVSDDGPDGKKMRRLVDEDPELTTAALECWAHQSHLMTGNYLSVKAGFMLAAEQAGEASNGSITTQRL